MLIDFWKEDYLLAPDFEDMYNFIDTNPGNTLVFVSKLEKEYGDDLFYQLCPDDFEPAQYEQCEDALRRAFSEILKQERFVAFAADRPIFQSRKARNLTGLEKLQLTALRNFCGRRQEIISDGDFENLLLCMTRGLASTCALAVNWKVLLLMQDLHGCIMFSNETDRVGLKYMVDALQKNDFVIAPLSTDVGQGDGLREP